MIDIHNRIHIKQSFSSKPIRLPDITPTEPCHTSEANQRAQPEHVMSTVIMYATRSPTCPHDNPSDRCHSVQVRSDPKAKYNPQRLHTHEIVHLLHMHYCFSYTRQIQTLGIFLPRPTISVFLHPQITCTWC